MNSGYRFQGLREKSLEAPEVLAADGIFQRIFKGKFPGIIRFSFNRKRRVGKFRFNKFSVSYFFRTGFQKAGVEAKFVKKFAACAEIYFNKIFVCQRPLSVIIEGTGHLTQWRNPAAHQFSVRCIFFSLFKTRRSEE